MKTKQLYIYNGIDNQLEEIENLAEAKVYIKDYIEGGDIHPDIESIIILEQVGGVIVDETGEKTELNNEIVPVCKVDVYLDERIPEINNNLLNLSKYIDWNKLWEEEICLETAKDNEKFESLISGFQKDKSVELYESECCLDEKGRLIFCFSETGGQNESDTQGWSRDYTFVFDSDFLLINAEYSQG